MNKTWKRTCALLLCMALLLTLLPAAKAVPAEPIHPADEDCEHNWEFIYHYTAQYPCQDSFNEYQCTLCGMWYTVVTEEATVEHILVFDGHVEAPAPCGDTYDRYVCARCGDEFWENYDPGNGEHQFSPSWISPTCTEPGYFRYVCENCGYTYEDYSNTAPPLGHEVMYIDSREAVYPCEDSVDIYQCVVCGAWIEEVTKPATEDHIMEFLTHVEAPAPCADSYDVYSCTRCCYEEWRNIVSGTGDHRLSSIWIEPNCVEEGHYVFICEECGLSYHDFAVTEPPLGHDWVFLFTEYAEYPCQQSNEVYECSRCGDRTLNCIGEPEVPHNMEFLGHVEAEGPCGDSFDVYRCTLCGWENQENVVPGTGAHVFTSMWIDPSCEEMGHTLYTCMYCGLAYAEYDETQPALGHIMVFHHTEYAAHPCQQTLNVYQCTRCGLMDLEVIQEAEKPHDLRFIEHVTPAAPCGSSYDLYCCAVCGDQFWENYTEGTGEHDMIAEWMEPTCVEPGHYLMTCKNCGEAYHNYDTIVPALEHVWEGTVLVLPTEKTEGEMLYTCTRCGDSYVETLPISTCPSAGFTDVKATSWYHDYVDFVVAHGIMKGTSDTTFAPNGNMTRAQLAQIFYNLAGAPEVTGKNPFTDVKEKHWFYTPVVWAASEGIVSGTSATTYGPNQNITRQDMVVMMYRAYGNGEKAANHLTEFKDGAKVSSYARDAVNWAIEYGYLKGSNGNLNPKDNMTRAQVATVFMNYQMANT